MRMPRARLFPAALLLLALAVAAACSVAPPPTQPPQPNATGQASVMQQQAGFAQRSDYPQQPPGAYPAPTATFAPPYGGGVIPGLVEAPPATVPDAVAQLDRAEQLLGFVLAPGGKVGAQAGEQPGPAPSASPGSPVPLGDPCLIACAALASMKRSADHVCTMAGEREAACGNARSRVQRAEQRVLSACPACAAK